VSTLPPSPHRLFSESAATVVVAPLTVFSASLPPSMHNNRSGE